MANRRVNLEPNYYNGQIFYAEDINTIIELLKTGVNTNKFDIDTILSGKTDSFVLYNSNGNITATLNGITDVYEGAFAFVYVRVPNESGVLVTDELVLYKYEEGVWIDKGKPNILELYLYMLEMKAKPPIGDVMLGTVRIYTESGPLSGTRVIDGIQTQANDKVLVAGLGQELNGIYYVNSSNWILDKKVEPNQVVSVKDGEIYGGAQLKKLENGTTTVVKDPERTKWVVQTT